MSYATANPNSWSAYNIPDSIEVKEFAIGGKLITAKILVPDMTSMDSVDIKKTLTDQLCAFILENNLAEFTKIPDMTRMSTSYIARIYLAPNEQVKILRTFSK